MHKCPEKYVGDIEVSGWIKTARESKNVGFIELGDGSAFRSVQVVYEHGEIPESVSKFFATGTAITVKGVLELTPEAKQSFEIKANEVAPAPPHEHFPGCFPCSQRCCTGNPSLFR